ncbi:MAG TPA: TIGR03435 family protein [Vicinamibacterales bacterium]|nr:TIGR03435 family protein [Vicinamibacterales bacterium]
MLRLPPPPVVWLLAVLVTSLATSVGAQEPTPTFEVAAVRRNQSTRSDWQQDVRPGGRFVATNMPLIRLIQYAYGVPDHRLEKVPSWARTERFDIEAKAEGDVPSAQVQLMLRSLLEDRFRLVIRRETREMPIRTLVLARSDGRLGPNLLRVPGPDDCKDAASTRRDTPPGAMTIGGCGAISGIAGLAGVHTESVVLDGTGLTGTFKFMMDYAPGLSVTGDPDLPSFVTALNEQLGLKLQPGRGPVDVLVLESIERLVEN